MNDPIREPDRQHERCRQCALCDHACYEADWLCACCARVAPDPLVEGWCTSLGQVYGPLLPPFIPQRVFARLLAQARAAVFAEDR